MCLLCLFSDTIPWVRKKEKCVGSFQTEQSVLNTRVCRTTFQCIHSGGINAELPEQKGKEIEQTKTVIFLYSL